MLKSLSIRNYALIDRLDIELPPGFSTITGETGAGKSIILGALALLLGSRADSKAIKQGERKCTVEAVFDIGTLGLEPFFRENDIDYQPDECILRREILASGKSRAFINDTPAGLQQLRELTSRLVDIHSQHKNLLLNQEDFLLDTLDGMAGNGSLRSEYAARYRAHRDLLAEQERTAGEVEAARAEEDYLRFQSAQLAEAALRDGEQEELEDEQERLSHAGEIQAALFQAAATLQDGEDNLTGRIKTITHALRTQAAASREAQALADRLESAYIELRDVATEAEREAERTDSDPARLAYVADRLNLIYTLEQKHRAASVAELLDRQADIDRRLEALTTGTERLDALAVEVDEAARRLNEVADALGAKRREAALRLADDLTARLAELGMPHAALRFSFEAKAPAENGCDRVALLFSANRNTALQDAAHIASGGETARLMLALKAATATRTTLPTVIFDEIDTGVSGRIAEKMALLMRQMADGGQVVSITHLPQIAARGSHQFRVYKQEDAQGTASRIALLTEEERVEEIAHMLSGESLTEAAVNNARSLLAEPNT